MGDTTLSSLILGKAPEFVENLAYGGGLTTGRGATTRIKDPEGLVDTATLPFAPGVMAIKGPLRGLGAGTIPSSSAIQDVGRLTSKIPVQSELARRVASIDPRFRGEMTVGEILGAMGKKEDDQLHAAGEAGQSMDEIVRAWAARHQPGLRVVERPLAKGEDPEGMMLIDHPNEPYIWQPVRGKPKPFKPTIVSKDPDDSR
jgi:hypothetical protein